MHPGLCHALLTVMISVNIGTSACSIQGDGLFVAESGASNEKVAAVLALEREHSLGLQK